MPIREIIELTQDLIRFKTMHSQPDEISRCVDFIEGWLKRGRLPYRRLEHNGYPSLLAAAPETEVPVLLMSHIDVVDAPDDLFEPRLENGCLYGRGSIDDKYAAALSLVLLKSFLGRHPQAERLPFGVLITADEEIGGANGAGKVLPVVKTRFCIALDGGSTQKIVIREKGILRLKLVAGGRSAHGARPWLGENAIENLIDDFLKLKPFFDYSEPGHWHRTLNFSRIQAGKSDNQVPDTAEALFDIRYTEKDDVDELVAAMQSAIKGELTVQTREPLFQGGASAFLDLLMEIAPGTATGFAHGASDARFLAEHGIDGIVWGADGENSQHSLDEHVRVDSLEKLYDILEQFGERLPEIRG
jgi:succinyl-diaminopimelate desuccinylase